ncbi:sodium-dependent proline transporter-like [Babylonia areolata]|uniref:sodium-dependent proline transporter-like n=1 Tax=Babylonia areolata TaxID=304850 RepID=UPI003FD399D2
MGGREKDSDNKAVQPASEAGTSEVERSTWGGQLDFFMSCVGYAVGLGNIWRFPYLCYKNGGGAFLIPYVIMLIICGLPLFFFELSFGQFASVGPITIWRVSPFFRGIGFGMVLISLMVCLYYNVIITYGLYYLLVSLTSMDDPLPWSTCGNAWNTAYCSAGKTDLTNLTDWERVNASLPFYNRTCVDSWLDSAGLTVDTLTYNQTLTNLSHCDESSLYKLPSDEYFTRNVLRLHEATDFSDMGGISLKLVVLLALAWLLVFACLLRGVETSGKVVYFMASFPYLVLIALLVRGVTLPGYIDGITFYIVPVWDRLTDVLVWREAATQIFYSLGPAFGTLITMASFNPFRHNCYRDAILVSLINCGTSIFAGFVIFSMLGYMAHATNQAVVNVTEDGPGLVFVVYPEGIARMPAAAVWAFLFFFMLVALGLDSQFATFETVISAVIDEFPHVLRQRRTMFGFFCHLMGFLLGIPMTTKGGIWLLTLLNDYSASYSLMVVCFCELIAVNYVYGNKRFCSDIQMMLGFEPNWYWRGTWMVVTPVAILVMIVMSGVQYAPATYGDYEFEPWVQGLGFAIAALPVACILLGFVVQGCRYKSIKAACQSDPKWGPSRPDHRTGRYAEVNLAFVDIDGDTGNNHTSHANLSPKTNGRHGAETGHSTAF